MLLALHNTLYLQQSHHRSTSKHNIAAISLPKPLLNFSNPISPRDAYYPLYFTPMNSY